MGACWISWGELAGLVGNDAAQALCSTRGGVTLYVPKVPDEGGELARILGMAALRKLVEVYGGEIIVTPNRRKEGPRKGKILDMLARGMSAREIALKLDVTQRYVEYLAKAGRQKVAQGNLLDTSN